MAPNNNNDDDNNNRNKNKNNNKFVENKVTEFRNDLNKDQCSSSRS